MTGVFIIRGTFEYRDTLEMVLVEEAEIEVMHLQVKEYQLRMISIRS